MKKLITAGAICTLMLPGVASADFIGIFAGASHWDPDYKGSIRSENTLLPRDIDLDEELGIDGDSHDVIWAAFEHPIPALPNIRVQSTDMELTGQNVLTQAITFENSIFLPGETLETSIDLSHQDLTLYYESLDNWASLDLGLSARQFDGGIKLTSLGTPVSEEVDFDDILPMLYVAARFQLPLTGLSVNAVGNGTGYSKSNYIDYTLSLSYESKIGLGGELGWRAMSLDLEDVSDITTDMDIDGAFATIYYHF